MKTVKSLNIKDWSGYFFTNLTNINDLDPEFLLINDFKGCKDGSTVINNKFKLDQSFQEIIYRLDNWVSNGSGWIVEEIISQYLNLSTYLPLSGSTYIKFPKELNHPMKGLINIQNNGNKCFLWCHVRHLNLDGVKLERVTKKDKEIVKNLDYSNVDFPVSKKDYGKIETLNKINAKVFSYENEVVYPVYLSNQCFNDCLDLLLI